MSTTFVEPIRNCHNCGPSLPLGALACEQCHALVHSEELLRISTRAKALEQQDQLLPAREEWLKALPLLPSNSTQAEWIRGQVYKLELAAKVSPPPKQKNPWPPNLGPLRPIPILLPQTKTLLPAIFNINSLF